MSNHKLGKRQKAVLSALKEKGSWYPCCGWVWNNCSGTKSILDSLVRKGLVSIKNNVYYISEK